YILLIFPLFPYTTLFRSCIAPATTNIGSMKSMVGPLRGARWIWRGQFSLSIRKLLTAALTVRLGSRGCQVLSPAERTSISSMVRSEEHTSELQSRENIVC